MAFGSVAIMGSITGLTGGSRTIAPPVISSTNAVDEVRMVSVPGNGLISVSIPTGAVAVVITPPHNNASARLTFKGDSGDVGFRIARDHPTLLSIDSFAPGVPTQFFLEASQNLSVEVAFL